MAVTPDPFADIKARRQRYLDSHNHPAAFACCTAHASADDVPLLLERISRLEAALASADDLPTRIASQALATEDQLRAELADSRAAHRTASESADRFRDVLADALGHPDENPGDDVLIAELRQHFGRTGPEPTRWRDFMAYADGLRAQLIAESEMEV